MTNHLSARSRADADAAIRQVMKLATREAEELTWPAEELQRALTRDGDHLVIDHLSALSAQAVSAASQESGTTPAAVVGKVGDTIHTAFGAADTPFSALALRRAQQLTLYRLGQPFRKRGGSLDAVDLAGALALLYVMALMLLSEAVKGATEDRDDVTW